MCSVVEMDNSWGNKKKGVVFVTLVASSEGGGYSAFGRVHEQNDVFLLAGQVMLLRVWMVTRELPKEVKESVTLN